MAGQDQAAKVRRLPVMVGAGLVGAGVAVVAVALWAWLALPRPTPEVTAALAPAESEGGADSPVPMSEPATGPDPAAAPADPEAPRPPRFDTVRHGPDGATLVAGFAAPGAEVAILIDGAEAARVAAAPSGAFVAMFDVAPSDAPRVLTLGLALEGDEMLMAEQSVILAPRVAALAEPAPSGDGAEDPTLPHAGSELATAEAAASGPADSGGTSSDPAVVERAAPEPTAPEAAPAQPALPQLAGSATPADPAQSADPASAAAEPAPSVLAEAAGARPEAGAVGVPAAAGPDGAAADPVAEAGAGATAVLLADAEGVRLLGAGPADNVVVDTITYGLDGEVQLAGRATGEGHVRLYLDNQDVTTAEITPGRDWTAAIEGVAQGVYTLRIDELDAEGTVVSRYETPFQREDPAQLAAVSPDLPPDGMQLRAITVQPGYTLWGIARAEYGRGIEYLRVYEANRSQIRNPDLIYPGQIFTMPD
ncbi:LysM peptidoglycan-binding domain-containing protein [Plastorhodobacter daqingensis]|uniref:LysM peptidoglycan-binding domain-containing protein n=1 Tax=Plastorhodobacter daqingensis TaxID=1387281 RepID=A0ABW2UNF0_9RHOB